MGKQTYTTSFNLFDKYEVENCEIVLVEDVKANSKDELFAREAYWIRELDCVNKKILGRTDKQYRDDNKEKLQEKSKTYHEKNKEKIKERKKIYHEKNKEKIQEKNKIYRDKHKEELYKHQNQPYLCNICNTTVTLQNKLRHEKSQKHLNNIK
jgi:hypothetical protein